MSVSLSHKVWRLDGWIKIISLYSGSHSGAGKSYARIPQTEASGTAFPCTWMGPRIEAIYLVILLFLFHIMAIVVTSIHCLSCFVHSVIRVSSAHQCLQRQRYGECICPSMTSCRYLLLCKQIYTQKLVLSIAPARRQVMGMHEFEPLPYHVDYMLTPYDFTTSLLWVLVLCRGLPSSSASQIVDLKTKARTQLHCVEIRTGEADKVSGKINGWRVPSNYLYTCIFIM